MIADTSVWIDFFAGRGTPEVELLVTAIDAEQDVGLTDVVYTELLQGLRNDGDVLPVERKLLSFPILRLEGLDDFRRAAEIYRATRRQGLTVRRTSDCLIASVCIRERRPLLHADIDFDRLAACSELQVVVAAG